VRKRPYPLLDAAAPLRLAFVGQTTYFKFCALQRPTDGLHPMFVEFRAGAPSGAMMTALTEFDPHVVLVFRPEIVPAGLFRDLDAVTVGYLTEPLPRKQEESHEDLRRRLDDLRFVDVANFDRIVSFDPLVADVAGSVTPVWRSLPLPVADEYFAPVRAPRNPPRALFVGRSTPHREQFLVPCKHRFDVVHIAHGISNEELLPFLEQADIGINLHNEPYPSFENRVSIHLAAGHLLLTEPLSPTHGLEPGIDYLEVGTPGELELMLTWAIDRPDAFRRVRLRGRRKAEQFRASRVYPRLVKDLLLDLSTRGERRPTS
jgi:hypothetical protein